MGADIHMAVEVKRDGFWTNIALDEPWSEFDREWRERNGGTYDWYDGRNYDEFAMLGNVRNGYGFAGCDTGDGFVPMSDNRGVPEDASYETLAELEVADHSFSWLTLEELLAYDFERTTKKRGWVNDDQFGKWIKTGTPSSWCGGVEGHHIYHVTWQEMKRRVEENRSTKHHYCNVEWAVPYRKCAPFLTERLIPKLQTLGAPRCVRIIFGFDS